MICVIPFCRKDSQLAVVLSRWIETLGNVKEHDALLICDPETQWSDAADSLAACRKAFASAKIVTINNTCNDWIEGSKATFYHAARIVRSMWKGTLKKNKTCWFFCEPDCVPLESNWLNKIEAEYMASGKLFMGPVIPVTIPGQSGEYMNGTAVYPHNAIDLLKDCEAIPGSFDHAMRDVVLKDCHATKLVQHFWGKANLAPTFAFQRTSLCPVNVMTRQSIDKDAVVFHRCKDGTLHRLARHWRNPFDSECNPPAFVQMGRFGDLIQLLPVMLKYYEATGKKPSIVTSEKFGSVLEGASYVQPIYLRMHWWKGFLDGYRQATRFNKLPIITQCHAVNWAVDVSKWDCYAKSLVERAGVGFEEYKKLPLVFNNRSPQREQDLADRWFNTGKPVFLVNFTGQSSPFPQVPEVMRTLYSLSAKISVVDLRNVKAYRIYDLLGLYDRAIGLITTDTATLHLAPASKIPYIAYTVDGWRSSVPLGNCKLEIKYSQTQSRLAELGKALEGILK